ncbi:CDP-2,3-bis-(O-geranylgeranyl)-sn-glycerol synthase [Candidatus Woesearchaeota archaeon]|nr:CDP-2,3-bis-(O-geranylgeranyl)-sn-glycerol synthase [Candidatus Woesearchaeota archaeon]
MLTILPYIWFMLPIYFANMAPVFVKDYFNKLAIPIDLGKKINNKRIFGNNKTYRGIILGIIFSIIIISFQKELYSIKFIKSISLVNYININLILWGFLMGFGALFGDLAGSFIKRRLDIKPGKSLILLDQLDFIAGGLFFISFVYKLNIKMIIIILPISFILTILVNHTSYYLKMREVKW